MDKSIVLLSSGKYCEFTKLASCFKVSPIWSLIGEYSKFCVDTFEMYFLIWFKIAGRFSSDLFFTSSKTCFTRSGEANTWVRKRSEFSVTWFLAPFTFKKAVAFVRNDSNGSVVVLVTALIKDSTADFSSFSRSFRESTCWVSIPGTAFWTTLTNGLEEVKENSSLRLVKILRKASENGKNIFFGGKLF